MKEPETTVTMGPSHPRSSTEDGSRPTSSSASRSAAVHSSSPSSRRPPGKATSPRCRRSPLDRRVRMTRALPSSSKSAHSTAERRMRSGGTRPWRTGSSWRACSTGTTVSGPSVPKRARPARTWSTVSARSRPSWTSQPAGRPGATFGGRGMCWSPPAIPSDSVLSSTR